MEISKININGTLYNIHDASITFDNVPTLNSLNAVTSGGLYTKLNDKADKVAVINHGTGDTTFEVTPNTLHIWGEVASLTLTLATPTDNTISNEYMILFTSGSTATTLSLPSGIAWLGGTAPTIAANKTYLISIINNLAVIGEF